MEGKKNPVPSKTNSSQKIIKELPAKVFESLDKTIDIKQPHPLNPNITFGGLLKLLYNANPFYLISAGLILYASTVIFNTADIWMETAVPIAILASYTLLLAGTSIFIVRLGSVWEDARSILLIILALLFLLSASLDEKALDSFIGLCWLGGGLVFSVFISELLRHGLRLKLPGRVTLVYYLYTVVFFSYPYLMAQLVNGYQDDKVPAIRGILFFPVLCALLLIPLISVIRKGREYTANNGTPWKWPLFPWSIFGLLAAAACFRTYLFSISFYAGKGVGQFSNLETGFSGYMLVPVVLMVMILILEFILTFSRKALLPILMLSPILLFVISIPVQGQTRVYMQFLKAFMGQNGSAMIPAVTAAIIFYLYAWYRKVKYSEFALCGLLFIYLLADMHFQTLSNLKIHSGIPAAAALAILALQVIRKRSSIAFLGFAFGASATLTLVFRDTSFMKYNGIIPVNMMFAAIIFASYFGKDELAKKLRIFAAGLIPVVFAITLLAGSRLLKGAPAGVIPAYLTALLGISLAFALTYKSKFYYLTGTASLVLLLIYGTIKLYDLFASGRREIRIIFWGTAFFLLALIISMIKGGIFNKIIHKIKFRQRTVKSN